MLNFCDLYKFLRMVLRKEFGPDRDAVTGKWRILHNGELNDLFSSANIYYSVHHIKKN
jgi:hypothetical protein